jgi:integrase
MGSLYKRGRIWWIKYYRNGKPIRASSRSRKLRDARALLRIQEAATKPLNFSDMEPNRVRFEEIANDFLNDYRANNRKSFVWAQRRTEQHLKPFFAGLRVTEITTEHVRAYRAKREAEGASNGSVNRELAALKRMFNLAAATTPPKVIHVPYIPMLRESNVRKGFFEHSEYLALRRELPEYLKPILILGYYTGARLGEILNLRWRQVDLKGRSVNLDPGTTKNDQPRTIPLAREVVKSLRALRSSKSVSSGHVFTRRGMPIRTFYVAWNSACERVGMRGKLFHDLRRTAVRNMVRAGVPERVAMAISGHKTRSIFERYNIVSERDLHMAARRLEAYLT